MLLRVFKSPHDCHLRLMGLDVPVRYRPQRIAFAIIVAGLITVPLIPLIDSPTSFAVGYVASVILTNVALACFVHRLAPRNVVEKPADMFESACSTDSGRQNPGTESDSDPGDSRRRLKIADLMVLVAAIAAGIVLVTQFLSDTHSLPSVERVWGWDQLEELYASLLMLVALTLGLAVTWIGRLRRPVRPFSQTPGAVACLLASLVIIAVALHLAANYATESSSVNRQSVFWRIQYWRAIIGHPPTAIGLLILAVWNLLLMSGRWAAEPTWIDRTSRALGLCWIVWAVINDVVIPALSLIIFWWIYGLWPA
jgi:hypothetical protein